MSGKYKSCTDYWLDTSAMKLRGDFEGMYRDIDDPWGCNQASSCLNNRLFVEVLFDGGRTFESILDIGSGLGGLTAFLHGANREKGKICGMEISPTAVEKAKKNFPGIEFQVKNILTDEIGARYDAIVLSEVLWYLLDDLEGVTNKIAAALNENGLFGVHQYFPDEQKFGTDTIKGLEGFLEFIKEKTPFRLKKSVVSFGETEGRVLLSTFVKG